MKTIILVLVALAAPSLTFAQTAPDTNPAHVKSGAYRVESTHTRVLFAVSHMGITTWYGEFTGVSGSLTLDPKNLAGSSFDITIPANTVTTTNTELDGKLNSPEWFDTAKYPVIEFKSVKIVRTAQNAALVTGALTFHGVTKPETLRVTFNAGGVYPVSEKYVIGFNAMGMLKRSDFNQTTYVPLIGDDVSLIISAAFIQT